jgi:hypothetical protein
MIVYRTTSKHGHKVFELRKQTPYEVHPKTSVTPLPPICNAQRALIQVLTMFANV